MLVTLTYHIEKEYGDMVGGIRMNSSLNYNLRTQFYFMTDQRTLSDILNQLSLYRINMNGYVQTEIVRDGSKLNILRIVTGTTEGENEYDLNTMRNILKHYRVRFQEKSVVQVLEILPEAPGQINAIYGSLWCKLSVNAIYVGEDTKIYLDVSDINQTIEILSQPALEMCP